MRLGLLSLGLSAILAVAEPEKRASPKLVLSHYMLGDITEEHAHKDIDDAIAMGIDGFVLNVGYPKLDWVSKTLSNMFGYADYRGNFKLVISLDLYATGAYCYDLKQKGQCDGNCDDCGGPKEYDNILKAFLGRDSYLHYGPKNLPLITTFSTGGKTNKDIKTWKDSFANQMYFMPGIDDTPGFWESHPAWWDYWEDLIDGAMVWESAWPQVHETTKDGDMSRDLKVIGPLQKAGKGYMIAVSLLQYKNSYGANLYRRGEMNVIKRMQNILTMEPQPDIVQLLTWNDGPESHHFGNIWPEQNTDKQPNQYASPQGSDHTGFQPLYSAFIHAWKNGGDMVPVSLSKRSVLEPHESIPQGALWHKPIFQSTTCPGGSSKTKYFQPPNGTDAGLDALQWALAVPANAAGWTVDVVSNGKSISSTTLKPGLNYGTVEKGVTAGTQRLIIQDGGRNIVAGTNRGRCLSEECHDGIYNFNPQIMGVQSDYDNRECWQVTGKAVLHYENDGYITGVTKGPLDSDSSCQDTFGSTSNPSMWDPLHCSEQLKDWFDNEYNTGQFANPNHNDHDRWLPQFAWPMGFQSSHENCVWGGSCESVDCTQSTEGSAWKFLVINSAAHLWSYFDIADKAITAAIGDFTTAKETEFELYWGNVAENVEPLNQFLNAIAITLGVLITAASLGTAAPAVALAGPVVGGLISVGILHNKAADVNIGNKIKVETIAKEWLDGWSDFLGPTVNDLVNGPGKSGDIDVQDIFSKGKWVLSDEATILGADLKDYRAIGRAVYHLILGAIINISWKSQNVYLACYNMTQTEYETQEAKGFRAGSNDTRLRMWYDGYGCFYQGVKPKKYGAYNYGYQIRPPGWGDMYEPGRTDNNPLGLPFDTHDVIVSSLEGFKKGGFKYNISTEDVTDIVFNLDKSTTVRDLARSPGFFQIPICWFKVAPELHADHKTTLDIFFQALAEVKSHTQNKYLAQCWDVKDDWGVSMNDVMDSNWIYG